MDSSSRATDDVVVEAGLDEQEEQRFSYAMQLVSSAALPMVLLAAIRLDVLEVIAKASPGAQLSPWALQPRCVLKTQMRLLCWIGCCGS